MFQQNALSCKYWQDLLETFQFSCYVDQKLWIRDKFTNVLQLEWHAVTQQSNVALHTNRELRCRKIHCLKKNTTCLYVTLKWHLDTWIYKSQIFNYKVLNIVHLKKLIGQIWSYNKTLRIVPISFIVFVKIFQTIILLFYGWNTPNSSSVIVILLLQYVFTSLSRAMSTELT